MAVAFTEALPPSEPAAIEEVEARLGVKLPDEYVRFLRKHNGGYLDDNYLPESGVSVRYLYSAGPNDHEYIDDLVSIAHLYSPEGEADDEMAPGFLPIGEDEGGNLICLKVSGDDRDAVYFWDHEVLPESEAYSRVADSIEDFLERLRPRSVVGFEKAFPPASDETIQRVEAALGITLPDEYRQFLQRQNGGYLEENFLPPDADVSVRYLYSAGPNDDDNIFDRETASEFYSPSSPADPEIDPDCLPIGENSFDDVLCIKVRGTDSGAVYLWSHDALANPDPFERIADGFGTLFAALRPGSE